MAMFPVYQGEYNNVSSSNQYKLEKPVLINDLYCHI